MPASARRWTVDEVREMQDEERAWPRFELIDGELIVTNAPRVVHQRGVREMVLVLHEYLARIGIGEVLTSPADIELEPDTIVQPDVFVLSEIGITSWREAKRLLLAVELLSPSTSRVDRVMKRRFFARVPVAEYWVVDLDARLVERTRAGEERPEILDRTLEWNPTAASEPLRIDLEAFFAKVHREPPSLP